MGISLLSSGAFHSIHDSHINLLDNVPAKKICVHLQWSLISSAPHIILTLALKPSL